LTALSKLSKIGINWPISSQLANFIIIVESPTKSKTIQKFVGRDYTVVSCYGHIRDLPKGKMGIDIENDFKPQYVIPTKKRKLVNELKKIAKKANKIIAATDEDREGEAIAWHLKEVLIPEDKKAKEMFSRITFHEITPTAIKNALKNPRQISISLVNSQKARRILDRLVGYELSPLLWEKVARHLSAGRVQSAALRLIVEREEEREKFKPQEYWSLKAIFKTTPPFEAVLKKIDNSPIKKPGLSKEEVKKIICDIKNKKFTVKKIEEKLSKLKPPPPFITSTLQIEANRKLGFSAQKTMGIAQRLYEGVPLGKNKLLGIITYIRTDSLNLSNDFLKSAKDFIIKEFGKEYLEERKYKTKSRLAQEAHEAIRPTEINFTPEKMKKYLQKDEYSLYNLIWKRALASQMSEAKIKVQKIILKAEGERKYLFEGEGRLILFPGYLTLFSEKQKSRLLPLLKENQSLELDKLSDAQHFTQPPPRFNDASLVKKLESLGIGRPSTYVSIIRTLETRNYVQKKWQEVIREFYFPFKKILDEKKEKVPSFKQPQVLLEEKCPECGAKLAIKTSRFGKFIACSNFPKCRYSRPIETFGKCPKCRKGDIVKKRNKRGQEFYACSRWPKCDYIAKNLKNDKI